MTQHIAAFLIILSSAAAQMTENDRDRLPGGRVHLSTKAFQCFDTICMLPTTNFVTQSTKYMQYRISTNVAMMTTDGCLSMPGVSQQLFGPVLLFLAGGLACLRSSSSRSLSAARRKYELCFPLVTIDGMHQTQWPLPVLGSRKEVRHFQRHCQCLGQGRRSATSSAFLLLLLLLIGLLEPVPCAFALWPASHANFSASVTVFNDLWVCDGMHALSTLA
jgi:hypothetical protein